MSVKINRPGIFSTIQDLGRSGHRSVGIGPGGAMDFFAASVANLLTGNAITDPVIEMHFPAAEMQFLSDGWLSITGADFGACIDAEPILSWRPVFIQRDSVLSFKQYVQGARTYVAVKGAFAADRWLTSYSTHMKVGRGGHNGRPLKKGDTIFFNDGQEECRMGTVDSIIQVLPSIYQPGHLIRCIAGPEWNELSKASQAMFTTEAFSVTAASDRMGYRLQGPDLSMMQPLELVSSPVDMGTVQLLPNGQAIVLMADHQTTGGYPRIANVITADWPKLAQLPIHASLNFQVVTPGNAEDALLSLQQTLQSISIICNH